MFYRGSIDLAKLQTSLKKILGKSKVVSLKVEALST